MQADQHIGESAELYAVGALEPQERATVETHIAHCAECLRRVGEAEETVLALERANVVDPSATHAGTRLAFGRRSLAWLLPLTAAAAFILGLLFPRPAPQNDFATLAMIGSHFSHAQFVGSGPPAKVIYARDHSWYYVIVEGRHRYGVYGVARYAEVKLGETAPVGRTSELFTRGSGTYERLELRESNAALGAATIR
jgi:anti-sigma factor RsiW